MTAKDEKPLPVTLLPFQGTPFHVLDWLAADLQDRGFSTLIPAPAPLPPEAYAPERHQYSAGPLLAIVHAVPGQHVLGITDRDLYSKELNFVFGMAEHPGKAAVIALPRLQIGADGDRFCMRVLKEALHELGHTFGLGHCPNPRCVMHFSNSLIDTDYKQAAFCPPCQTRLPSPLSAHPGLALDESSTER